MSPALINIALWIPFGVIVFISGLIFCISGYKKGLWRALIALAATVVAAAVSLVLARLLGGIIAPELVAMIPESYLADAELPMDLMMDIINGLVKMAVSLVLFPVFMFILTIILRVISYHIQKEKLKPASKSMQVGGMVIGAVSAVVYTLLLLLPLYGTLSTYVPVVESLMSMRPTEQEDKVSQYLHAVTSHPIVEISGAGPVASVYSGLASVDVGETSLDVPRMARTMDETMVALQAVMDAEDEDLQERVKELVDILRYDVVEQKWFYDLAQESIAELRNAIPVEEDPEAAAIVLKVLDVLDCPQEVFAENCAAIMDFAAYALEQDVITIFENEDVDALYESGIIAQAGKLANCSSEAVQIKKILLSVYVMATQKTDLDTATTYLESLGVGQTTDPAAQEKEAEAILLIMGMDGCCEADIIMRHPNMGEPVLQQRIAQKGFAEVFGVGDADWAEKINKDPALQAKLLEKLRQCSQMPLGTVTIRDYIRQLSLVKTFAATGEYNYGNSGYPDTHIFALDVLGQTPFKKGSMGKAGAAVYTFYRTLVWQVQANPELICHENEDGSRENEDYMQTVSAMAELICAARQGKLPTKYKTAMESGKLERWLGWYLFDESGVVAVKALVEAHGNDPLDLARYLSSNQKTVFKQVLDWMTGEEYLSNPTDEQLQILAQKAAWLKKFFGIS